MFAKNLSIAALAFAGSQAIRIESQAQLELDFCYDDCREVEDVDHEYWHCIVECEEYGGEPVDLA